MSCVSNLLCLRHLQIIPRRSIDDPACIALYSRVAHTAHRMNAQLRCSCSKSQSIEGGNNMARSVFGVSVVIAFAVACAAQEIQPYRANGYVFAAPGIVSGAGNATMAFGGGGEAALWKGLG